jgi:hypothetical protein
MLGRYSALVPRHHRRLIRLHRLARPNWYVGAAEHPTLPRDPALVEEVERLKKRLRDHPGGAVAVVAPEHQTSSAVAVVTPEHETSSAVAPEKKN